MIRDPLDDADRDARIDRDFEREPTLQRRRPRATAEELRLRSLLVGFRPDTSEDPTGGER